MRYKKLSINLNDYPYQENFSRFNVIGYKKVLQDDTNPVQIDSVRIFPALKNINTKDFKYYMYVLSQLVTNDKPVIVDLVECFQVAGNAPHDEILKGLRRCVLAGLLFRVEGKRSTYFVNPAYAWKGNRFDYLDMSAF